MKENFKQMPDRIGRLHQSYKPYYPASFFVGGFIFDILTLDRIDSWITIVQQGLFLLIISRILYFRCLDMNNELSIPKPLAKLWNYHVEALHFLLGSLLSAFTLFYFVSSSLSTSIIFMILMSGLLILNEMPALQGSRMPVKMAMFALCLFSFFSYLVPTMIGFVGFIPLLLALVLSGLVFLSIKKALIKKGLSEDFTMKNLIYPSGGVFAAIAILYFLKILPPLPLAVQYIGVYHNVEKKDGQFHLIYERPFWKFWQNGAESFVAQDGDRVYCFARIFSPAYFSDEVIFHWQKYSEDGWLTADRVPVKVLGGRDEGFRAYTSKSNFTEGEWRVKIESQDQREIGRISFSIAKRARAIPSSERNFKVDVH